ncbi:MAG: BCCT family transporter, partial [Rhodospirillaceae bacterium]|nr:BCCT family transporter [Rhodospirillaceae bacterium]
MTPAATGRPSVTERSSATGRPSAEFAVLIPSIAIAGLFAAAFLASPEETGVWAQSVNAAIGTNFSWLYLAFGMVALGFCLWLALGPHGSVKLGGADEPVEFSTPHWVAMMFTAGIGAGTVAWGFGEPIYYLETPPLGIAPYSSEAYEWGHMYPMLHWGIIPWAFYALPAVPIAYTLYVERARFLRIGEASAAALPRFGHSTWKVVIDVFIVLGIIAGTTTSLGIGVPLVSALLAELTGLQDSIPVKVAVLTVWVLLFGASTLRGLKRGIQKLADFNMVLAILLLLVILVVGPTLFIVKMIVNSLGLMADNFFHTNLWTDPIGQ